MLSKGDYLLFYGLTKETGKQGYKGGSDESDTAASHELLHTLRLSSCSIKK